MSASRGEDGAFPLGSLETPSAFNCQICAYEKNFLKKSIVQWPRGIATNGQIKSSVGLVEAPFPTASASSRTSKLLVTALDGFVSANFISHFTNASHHALLTAEHMSTCTREEFREYSGHRTAKTKSAPRFGPHHSIKSRGASITLLLPSCVPGKLHCNTASMTLLDAFALIAASPLSSKHMARARAESSKSTAHDDDDEVVAAFKNARLSADIAEDVPRTTSQARLAVMCGEDDVSACLNSFHVNTKDGLWKTKPSLLISICTQNESAPIKNVHAFVLDDFDSIEGALEGIQKTCFNVKMQEDLGSFVLPPAFLSSSAVNFVPLSDSDTQPHHFIALQASMQTSFHRLHQSDPVLELDQLKAADVKLNGMTGVWARVCSMGLAWRPDEGAHDIGMIFASDQQLLTDYLRRCAMESNTNQAITLGQENVVYKLLEPDLDEERANICILWIRFERAFVGSKLSLFAPRRTPGEPVTEFEGCEVGRLVPILSSFQSISRSSIVVPVTQKSIMPNSNWKLQHTKAFAAIIEESRLHLIKTLGSHASAEEDKSAELQLQLQLQLDNAETTGEDEISGKFYEALLCSKLAHPCVSVGDAIDVLAEHHVERRVDAASLRGLLQTGARLLGAHTSMQQLMERCETALVSSSLEVVRCESPRKRSRTPVADSVADAVADAGDPLVHILQNADKHASLLSMCGVNEKFTDDADGEGEVLSVEPEIHVSEDCEEFFALSMFAAQMLGHNIDSLDIDKNHANAVRFFGDFEKLEICVSKVGKMIVAISAALLQLSPNTGVALIDSTHNFSENAVVIISKNDLKPHRASVSELLARTSTKRTVLWAQAEGSGDDCATVVRCFA